MAETYQNISDTFLMPPSCREQFLTLQAEYAWPLRERGVFVAGLSELAAPFTVGRRAPSFHAVLWTLSGKARFITPDSAGCMEPGELWVGPAGVPYRYQAIENWRVAWFHLADTPAWSSLSHTGISVRPTHSGEALHGAMAGLLSEAVRGESGAETVARAYAEILGVLLDRELCAWDSGAARHSRQQLAHLWEQVSADLGAPWNVTALAQRLCLSNAHLHRMSVRHTGLAPMAQVTRLRMERAEAMLRNHDYTLGQIASVIGYETPFAFSRAFKRHSGYSPRAFRERA